METKAKKILKLLLGWAFMLFGVVGLFLPFLKGILFLFIGLVILSSEYVWAHRLLSKIRNRFPSVTARLDKATTVMHDWIGKVFNRSGWTQLMCENIVGEKSLLHSSPLVRPPARRTHADLPLAG